MTARMTEILCTTCSAAKRRDAAPLPALERYTSPRIRALARRGRRTGGTIAILSGEYGLIDASTPVPWYDHALAPHEVEAMAARVAAQLGERGADRLVFYARPAVTPGWAPYHGVLERACAAAGVELEVRPAEPDLIGADAGLADELFDLIERDEQLRAELAATGELFDGYATAMEETHRSNARELAAILDRYGWPGKTLVGAEAALAAWVVAQHAISLPDFQRRCRRLLARAVEAGEVEPAHYARLIDRIRFNERRPQRFGTIFDWDVNGELSPWPIEDEDRVDTRRASRGLPPLAESVELARREAAAEAQGPPADFAARQREIDRWSRAVGWLPVEPEPGSAPDGC